MTANQTRLYEAFDRMLKTLDIQAQDLCNITGISKSRVSSFRNGKRSNMGMDYLEALLDAAESINPTAREVFANYVGGKGKTVEEMTLKEKGALMVSLSRSIQSGISTQSSISTDSKLTENA